MHMYGGLCVLMMDGCVRIHNGNKWALTQCIMIDLFLKAVLSWWK